MSHVGRNRISPYGMPHMGHGSAGATRSRSRSRMTLFQSAAFAVAVPAVLSMRCSRSPA
jgi:hypothetical protein